MWCLTPSIYSLEQEEESWATCRSDTDLLAQSKSKHIHEKFCLRGSLTEAYLNSLSGMMLKHSDQIIQTQKTTSNFLEKGDRNSPYVAGSRNCAKTLAQQARAQDLTETAAASGTKWQGSFARYSLDSSLWKTAQCSLLADSDEFSETWPRWGSMRNGASYLRPTPALPICESASGFWQTPVADDACNRASGKWNSRGEPKLSAEVKLWPTPRANDAEKRGNFDVTNPRNGLPAAAKSCSVHWRTPNASDSNKWSKQPMEDRLAKGQQIRLNTQVSPDGSQAGQLNPNWVEWLMGWPIGWTDLKPLATAKFQEWLQQHGGF